jgi:hypothetical protein
LRFHMGAFDVTWSILKKKDEMCEECGMKKMHCMAKKMGCGEKRA